MSWRDHTTIDDKVVGAWNKISKLPSAIKSFVNRPAPQPLAQLAQTASRFNPIQKAVNKIKQVANTPVSVETARKFQQGGQYDPVSIIRKVPKFDIAGKINNKPLRTIANVANKVGDYGLGVVSGERDILPTVKYTTKFMDAPKSNIAKGVYNFGAGIVNSIGSEGIIRPVNDLVQGTVDFAKGNPLNFKSGAFRLGQDIASGSTPQKALADAAQTVMPILNAWGGGKVLNAFEGKAIKAVLAGEFGKELQKQAMKKIALNSAKQGFKVGGSFGLAQGLIDNKDKSLSEDLINSGISGLVGGATGAAIGYATPYASRGVSRAVKDTKDFFNPKTTKFNPQSLIWRGINATEGTPAGMSIKNVGKKQGDDLIQQARKYKSAEEFRKSIGNNEVDLEDLIQFHGTQKGNDVRKALLDGTLKKTKGRYGEGFYLTTSEELGDYFGRQIAVYDNAGNYLHRSMTKNQPDVIPFDLSGLKIKKLSDVKHSFGQSDLDKLVAEGYDGVNFTDLGETVIAKPEKLKIADIEGLWNKAHQPQVPVQLKDTMYSPKRLREAINDYNKQKAFIPDIPQEQAEGMVGGAQYLASQNPKGFQKLVDSYVAKRDVGRVAAYEMAQKINVPQKEAWNIVKAIDEGQTNVPIQNKEAIIAFEGAFDKLHTKARSLGMDIGYLKNYITHIWQESPKDVERIWASAKSKFPYAKERVVPDYKTGMKIGLHPKYTNPKQILFEYARKLDETIAKIDFVENATKQGYIVPAGVAQKYSGLEPIPIGIMRNTTRIGDKTISGQLYAAPEIVKKLKNLFQINPEGRLDKALEKSANFSRTFQNVYLSGGAPGTPINAFSAAIGLKNTLAGHPVETMKAATLSFSKKATENYKLKNIESIKQLAGRNLDIRTTEARLLDNSPLVSLMKQNGVWPGIKEGWKRTMEDPTFARFLPILKIERFKNTRDQLIKNGLTKEDAIKIAAEALKRFDGMVSTGDRAVRDRTIENVKTTFLFAPTYREQMINLWVNVAKSLANPLKKENRDVVKFALGATASLIALDTINQYTTGHGMLDNPDNKTDKALIPFGDKTIGIPFLSSIATVPRSLFREGKMLTEGKFKEAAADAFSTYGAAWMKAPIDILRNENYFGKQIYGENDFPSERWSKATKYLLKEGVSHPWLRATLQRQEGDPLAQTLSEGMELPLRWYKTDNLSVSKFWDRYSELEPYDKKLKTLLKEGETEKAQEFYNKNKTKIDEYRQMTPLKNTYTKMKKQGEGNKFGKFLQSFTGKTVPNTFIGGEMPKGNDFSSIAYGYDFSDIKDVDTRTLSGFSRIKEARSQLKRLYGDPNVPEEVKQELYAQAGVRKSDVEMDIIRTLPNTEKAHYIRQIMKTRKGIAYVIKTNMLTTGTKGTIAEMERQGLITPEIADTLTRIVKSKSSVSKSTTKRKKSVKTKSVKMPKIKTTKSASVKLPTAKSLFK